MAQDVGCTLPPEKMIQPDDISEVIRFLLRLSPGANVREIVIHCGDE